MEFKCFIEKSELEMDGNLKAVCGLFFGWCNFRCPYCNNFALNENPECFESFSVTYVTEFLKHNSIDVVCFTGGEPLLPRRKKQLFNYIRYLKDCGYSIWLETNGYAHHILKDFVCHGMVDFISMDVKASLDKSSYSRAAGLPVRVSNIRKSIELILGRDVPHEFRTTLVPSIVNVEDIFQISSYLAGANRYILQGYSPHNARDPRFRELEPFGEDVVLDMVNAARANVEDTIYRPPHVISAEE